MTSDNLPGDGGHVVPGGDEEVEVLLVVEVGQPGEQDVLVRQPAPDLEQPNTAKYSAMVLPAHHVGDVEGEDPVLRPAKHSAVQQDFSSDFSFQSGCTWYILLDQ